MRIELLFELEHKELPKDNSSIWISFLKNVLSNCNQGKFYKRYFSGTDSKDYSFSIILPKPRFIQEKILLENSLVKMIFSADDRNKTGLIFLAAFVESKNRKFPLPEGNSMILKQIRKLREQKISSQSVIFRTVTGGGLVVREHNKDTNIDKYYTFQDEGFHEKLKSVLIAQAKEAGFSESIAENIIMTPIQCKKVLVKYYGIYIDVTVGTFQLEGAPELLQYFYQAGFLSKHSAGFGLLDIVSQQNG